MSDDGSLVGHAATLPSQGRLIPRFTVSERVAHWLLAATFAAMLATGVLMGGIGPLGHRAMLVVHVGSAIVLVGGIGVLAARRRSRRPLAQTVHDLRPLGPADKRWLRLAPRAYLAGGALPPSGRFNAGQKVNARLILLVLAVLYLSGLGELGRYASFLSPIRILGAPHGLAAGVAGMLVAGHIYLALLHRATRPALRGITLGSVRRDWAEHHHAEWVAAVDADAARAGSAHSPSA
jgi:formate dehydrogenase subunit gamma